MPKVLAEPRPKASAVPSKFVADARELARIIRGLQSQGKTVVFMNGVFELLHVGHVRALRDAKSRGDFLIVALQSDGAVREAKGTGRPLMPVMERAELLSLADCIDYVTSYDAPTADELLLLLRPNIHARGTDFKEATVPERATVESYGGRVAIVGDRKKHSTTDLIRKAKGLRKVN